MRSLGFAIRLICKTSFIFSWKKDVAWRYHINVAPGFFGVSMPVAQGEVVLKGTRVLERGSDILEGFFLFFCDKFDEIYFLLGSSRWARFLFIEDTRFTRNIDLEAFKVDVED